jgi:hypothetical protein
VPHGNHLDYHVAGHLHHPHGDHRDDHGPLVLPRGYSVLTGQQAAVGPLARPGTPRRSGRIGSAIACAYSSCRPSDPCIHRTSATVARARIARKCGYASQQSPCPSSRPWAPALSIRSRHPDGPGAAGFAGRLVSPRRAASFAFLCRRNHG